MSGIDTCALCPRLCRSSCPVATGSGREAAVPANIGVTVLRAERGELPTALGAEAASLCTDCGACQAHCHLDRPLPSLLRAARAAWLPSPSMQPLPLLEGRGERVAVEADDRPLAAVLERFFGEPVRRLVTRDRLGVAAVEHPVWTQRAERLRRLLDGLDVIVVDGGVARALDAAGVSYRWLHRVVDTLEPGLSSCRAPGEDRPLACCGAAGPLPRIQPDDAARVGRAFAARTERRRVADARCRGHLRACGVDVRDPLDQLIEELS